MESSDTNPYASLKTLPSSTITSVPSAPTATSRIASVAFWFAIAGLFFAFPVALLGPAVFVWLLPPGTPMAIGYFVASLTVWIMVASIIAGPISAVICAIWGTWPQRAIILLVTLLYTPLLLRFVPRLWHNLMMNL